MPDADCEMLLMAQTEKFFLENYGQVTLRTTLKKLKNKFELKIYEQLKRSRCKYAYESERIPYVLAGHYIPDFVLSTPTGKVYIETKGYLRPEHKRKMVAVKRSHPEIDLRILFYAPKKEYIRWAERNGIKYAISVIPQEWLDGF